MQDYIERLIEKEIDGWAKTGKILLLLGARQTGKTTLLKHIFSGKKTAYLNLDVIADRVKFESSAVIEASSAMKLLGNPEIIVIDEAQRMPEAGRIVKGWFDYQVPQKIVLSGSSSLDLLNQSAESLTGRNIKIYTTPFLFREILNVQDPMVSNSPANFKKQVDVILRTLVVYGSYPETYKLAEKEEYLSRLVSDYLLKDILQFDLVKNSQLIGKMLLLLAYQVGSIVSLNEIANSLGISRITVMKYIDLLEKIFVIFRLPAYSTNPRKEIAKSEKIYFWDNGVRNALIGSFSDALEQRDDLGKLWENWVISEYAKRSLIEYDMKRLYFWRSYSGSEVDLIVKNVKDGSIKGYEIKWSNKKISKTFTKRYGISIEVINKENYLDYLL